MSVPTGSATWNQHEFDMRSFIVIDAPVCPLALLHGPQVIDSRGNVDLRRKVQRIYPVIHAFIRGPKLIAHVEDFLATTLSRVGDVEVDRAMTAPLVDLDELRPQVFSLGDRFHDIEPIDIADMPRGVSQFVGV